MERSQSALAFVVQFRSETDIATGRVEGKVEHIASYQAMRFHSIEEMLAFMARILGELEDPAPS